MSVVIPLVGTVWWFSQNVVLASDFQQHLTDAEVKDLRSDKKWLLSEYYFLRGKEQLSEFEEARQLQITDEIEEIDAEVKALRAK